MQLIFNKGGVILVFDRTGSDSKQCQWSPFYPFYTPFPLPLLSFLALIIFSSSFSAFSLLHSVWWFPSLLLQTFSLHMMDNLAEVVLGFQDGVPRGNGQSFLLVPEENAWGGKASAEARGWSAVVGQPCGFCVIRKVVGDCPRSKTVDFMVFVSVSPGLLYCT